jgi:FkbM family methyltransferase
MKCANALLDLAVRKFGYVPWRLSDRGQDRWIIDEVFPQKTGGFFLELGAGDGFGQSNTYVLEKRYGWRGICVEPHPELFDALVNRYKRTCRCAPYAIDCKRGSVELVLSGTTSGLVTDESDNSPSRRPQLIDRARARGQVKFVEAMPLEELLDKYCAPRVIDYFSLDVEGLETRILRDFPFNRYTFLALTIERPTPELNALLFGQGYQFVRNSLYDTFYVHETLPNLGRIKRAPFEQLPAKDF